MFNIKPISPSQSPAWPSRPEQYQEQIFADFSGGLVTAYPQSALRDDQFSVLNNFLIERDGTLKVREPFAPYLAGGSVDAQIPSTYTPRNFTIVKIGTSTHLVGSWSDGTNMVVSVMDESNDRWAGDGGGTEIKTDLTDGYDVDFLKFSINEAEDVIFANGKDAPQRWVGTVDTASTDLGLAVPAFEGAEAAAEDNTIGAADRGLTVSGVYTYKFTYFYDSSGTNTKYGESGPSAALTSADLSNASDTNPVAVDLDLDLDGSDLPTGVSKCNVYRSPADRANGPFRYVGFFESGDTYKDNTPNDEEGVEIPIDAGTPPRLKYITYYQGQIIGAGLTSTGALTNKLVFSEAGKPDYFPALNYVYFPAEITGIAEFDKKLYVWTRTQTFVFPEGQLGSSSEAFKLCEKGCSSHRSIQDVGHGLVWQGDNNVF